MTPAATRISRHGIRRVPAWVWFAALVIGAVRLAALSPDRRPDSYSIHGWFTEQGLPSNKIRALTQTRDGYLWLATAQGIARFDGSRFTNFTGATNPELRGGGFYAVQEMPDGSLWFGGDNGLFRWRNGHFDRFTTEQGLAHIYVRGLGLTRDGALVACTREGFSFVRDGRITSPGGIWKQPTGFTRFYLEQTGGGCLLVTYDGVWRIAGDKISRIAGTPEFPGEAFTSLVETPDGSLWFGYNRGVRCIHPDGKFEDYGAAQGLVNPRVAALRADRDGNLWIGTYGGGLYRLSHGRIEAAAYPDHFAGAVMQYFCEDREGGLWIAGAPGVFRLEDNVSRSIGPAEGLLQTSVYSVLEAHDGTWWFGLWGGGVYRSDGVHATRLELPAALGLDQVLSLAEEPAGILWIGANSGLYRHTPNGTSNLYDPKKAGAWKAQIAKEPEALLPGLAHPHANSIAADGKGGLWVATDGALYHGREKSWHAHTNLRGLPGNSFKSVVRTRNGDIWIAAPPDGVACLHDGQWTTYLCGKVISEVSPRAIFEDSAGTIWVTTEGGGLNRFKKGRWQTFTTRDGLADDFISGITEDGLRCLWIAYPRGIMRIPLDQFDALELDDRSVLEPRIFNRFDGLPAAEVNQLGAPNACRTRDGRVLFATDRGVAVIEPDRLKINQLVPPLYVESLVVNGTDTDLSRPVVVPPGSNGVLINYTAISLLAPEKVRFKIRLAPLDHDWVDMGARRDVLYAKLAAGTYTFHVIACNNDGVWNEAGANLAFTVRPFFYQTFWFIGLTTLAGSATVFGAYRTRVQLARNRMVALETLVGERTHELRQAKEAAEAAREEIARERARFKFIFESLPVGVTWMISDALDTRIVNPAHARLSGIAPDQSRRLELYREATHPEDRARQDELHHRLLAGEFDHYTLEKRYAHPDGAVTWAAVTVRVFSDPASGELQEISTLVDITERKLAEEELRWKTAFLEALVDSSLLGIRVADLQGRVIFQNRRLAELWKISPDILAQGDDAIQLQFVLSQLKQPDEIAGKLVHPSSDTNRIEQDEIELKDGTVLDRYSAPVIGRDGTTYGRISAYRDITERKRNEEELEKVHRQLLAASRQAGMAEIATSVLHNIGNVLNSVNVSATMLEDQVRESKSSGVTRLSGLLHAQRADIAGFFARDARALQVPGYLDSLSAHLAAERVAMLAELESLRKNIEHIKHIVAMQQNYAKLSGVVETVGVVELVEDALRINAAAFARHDVVVVRDFQAQPVVTVERHKVVQILVNLMRNAKYACKDSGRREKQLFVRITSQDGRMQVAVVDNGVGIPAENLARIFNHGFTTRADGHGFGLHHGAIIAKELGGSLTAQSEGPGLGATFVLELPVSPATP